MGGFAIVQRDGVRSLRTFLEVFVRRIGMMTVGTRGDVAALLGLAEEFLRRNVQVTFCAPTQFRDFIKKLDCRFVDYGSGFESGDSVEPGIKQVWDLARRSMLTTLAGDHEPVVRALEGVDAMLGASAAMLAHSIAEKLGVPFRYILLAPNIVRNDEIGPIPEFKHGVGLQWRIANAAFEFEFKRPFNEARQKLGLAPQTSNLQQHVMGEAPLLLSCPHLGPKLRGSKPEPVQFGYPFLRAQLEEIPRGLENFLAAGSAPVLFNMGSMSILAEKQQTPLHDVAIDVCRELGVRGVVSHPECPPMPGDVFACRATPHAWLLPKVAAIVHHGGAGTTASAAAAGIPQVVVPHVECIIDQDYWGSRVKALGLGPAPIHRSRLTTKNLTEALRGALSAECRANAAALAPKIKSRAKETVAYLLREWKR